MMEAATVIKDEGSLNVFSPDVYRCWLSSVHILHHEQKFGTLNSLYWNVHICIVIMYCMFYICHS